MIDEVKEGCCCEFGLSTIERLECFRFAIVDLEAMVNLRTALGGGTMFRAV